MMKLATPIVLPPAIDYADKLPANTGMYLNDTLGCCTISAIYHMLQLMSVNSWGVETVEPDACCLMTYEAACGYDPSNPSTDQGGVEQDVLTYLLNTGAVTGMNEETHHKIMAFIETDVRNLDDIKRTIYECGCAYIGFQVPQSIMPANAPPPGIWDVGGDQTILGGHAIILTGYDNQGFYLISWGQKYLMTFDFFTAFTEEAYAIADREFITATGKSPLGLTIAELEAQMQGLKP
jgi:hypothetical protein